MFLFFFFNDTPTTEIYTTTDTLSLHDALPISRRLSDRPYPRPLRLPRRVRAHAFLGAHPTLVDGQDRLLREADRLLHVERERRRIPPHDAVAPGLGHVEA